MINSLITDDWLPLINLFDVGDYLSEIN